MGFLKAACKRHGVDSARALLDICLQSLAELTVIEQFAQRRISSIAVRPLLVMGCIGPSPKPSRSFRVCLRVDLLEPGSESEAIFTLAHELGHTFNLGWRGREVIWVGGRRGSSAVNQVETFADTFALRWLRDEENKKGALELVRKLHELAELRYAKSDDPTVPF
jgi:hypothetical protein